MGDFFFHGESEGLEEDGWRYERDGGRERERENVCLSERKRERMWILDLRVGEVPWRQESGCAWLRLMLS